MALSDDERFAFDLTGYLVRPSILGADEIAAIREQIERVHRDRESVPTAERHPPGGASALLVGHPRIADVLEALLGRLVRCDTSFFIFRRRGESFSGGALHRGAWSSADPLFGYRVHNGRIHAGQVNVVVELTDVAEDDGATAFIPGSHKSEFPLPPGHAGIEPGARSPFYRGYACPAGSAIFFNESLLHAGPVWRRATPRVAVLSTYLPVGLCHHRPDVPAESIASLPREKQAWFREPWTIDFQPQPPVANSTETFVARDQPFATRRGG